MIEQYTEEEILKILKQRERNKENQKKWKENNPDKVKEYYKKNYVPVKDKTEDDLKIYREKSILAKEKARDKRINNKEKYLLDSAIRRARKNKIEINITEEDIIVPNICPVLGIELCFTNNTIMDNSPSLDRIDPSKGYVKGNVMVMSFLANSMKRTADSETLLKFADWIYSTFKPEN